MQSSKSAGCPDQGDHNAFGQVHEGLSSSVAPSSLRGCNAGADMWRSALRASIGEGELPAEVHFTGLPPS